jgi:Raf kinase inhibitor-like YbhB/YbcL family protein
MGFAPSKMQLTSPAFAAGGAMPAKYTGEGEDVSPPLAWSAAPQEAQSFAVICHDPDAPLVAANGSYGFVHWVLYDIPASVTDLPEGVADYTAGNNDFGKPGYNGPMPPNGHGPHHYYFWLLALKERPQLAAGLSMGELLQKIEPLVIGMNRLVGRYERT